LLQHVGDRTERAVGVCASEMAAFALMTPWFMPLTCDCIAVPIAKPAGSSMALLMRRPDDSCSTALFSLLVLFDMSVCVMSDSTLVLTIIDIFVSFQIL
jgi:hypothetical protein